MSILFLLPLLAVQDGGSFQHEDPPIELNVSGKGFESKTYETPSRGDLWGWSGTLFEFRHPDLLLHGILLYSKSAMRVTRYADWRERQWKAHNKSVKRLSEREITGKRGTWLVREYWVETEQNEFHYLHLFINDGRHNVEFLMWSPDAVWKENEDLANKTLDGFRYGEVVVEP